MPGATCGCAPNSRPWTRRCRLWPPPTAGRIACASGADKAKVVMKIEMADMSPYFENRIFSGEDLPRSKPAPDVYPAAAAHLRADPTRCLVIEETATSVRAGLHVGETVWGYCPAGHGRAFEGLPVARVFITWTSWWRRFEAPSVLSLACDACIGLTAKKNQRLRPARRLTQTTRKGPRAAAGC